MFNIRIDVYLIWCISVGMCTGLIWQFLFWLIEDLASAQGCNAMNYVKTLEGIVQAIQVIITLIYYLFSIFIYFSFFIYFSIGRMFCSPFFLLTYPTYMPQKKTWYTEFVQNSLPLDRKIPQNEKSEKRFSKFKYFFFSCIILNCDLNLCLFELGNIFFTE